jgi:8-oxo-dGTP pyrophosphatase MutT (NUDIX family)
MKKPPAPQAVFFRPVNCEDTMTAATSLTKLPNFNPRQVPIVGVDGHLPAVPNQALTERALRQRFAAPPLWEPEVQFEHRFTDRAPAQAAVLVALVMRERPTLLLTQRTSTMNTHAGQVAFAGGKVDDTDASVEDAALREAWEEVGLEARHVQIIGRLNEYITGTAFHITPVVALVSPDHSLRINPSEVDHAFEVPLSFILNPAHHNRHRLHFNGIEREWFSMPYIDPVTGDERYIWGATAGMLRNFYRFMMA